MDWMYKGVSGHVDREDYLMGRKIDKTFEMIDSEENPQLHKIEDEFILPSTSSNKNTNIEQSLISSTTTLSSSKSDIVAKMHEDPLFQIKMKQIEHRKELLKNPLKLKKLKNLLQYSLEKEEKSRKKHKKDKKKKKKHHNKKSHKHSSSSSSDSESETNDSKDSKKSEQYYHHHHHNHHRHKNDRKHYIHNDDQKQKELKYYHNRDNHYNRDNYRDNNRNRSSTRIKLSQEEIEKKRNEMIINANWRENTRHENVKKSIKKDKIEEELTRQTFRNQNNDDDDDNDNNDGNNFIDKMLQKLTNNNTIEKSLKQKHFNLQRSNQRNIDNDKNFFKKC